VAWGGRHFLIVGGRHFSTGPGMALPHVGDLGVYKGVTRLDGARVKKQIWHPMLEPKFFGSECIVLKKILVILLGPGADLPLR